MTAPGRATRRRPRTDRLTTAWLIAALVTIAVGLVAPEALPQPLWTMIHVVTLGVLSNAILAWSWYFARTLLHLPAHDHRSGRDATVRTVVFNVALAGLIAAMWTANVWATVVLAGLIGAVIAWHGLALVRAARTRLGNRFAVVVRYYVAAAAFLVVGCVLAGFVTVAMFAAGAPAWLLADRDRLTFAHALVNVAGWAGLTMAGTLVTLGPTMLRTRLDPAALSHAVGALPWLSAGIATAAVAATVGWMPGVGVGLLAFAAALAVGVALPLVRAAWGARPSTYATWTMTTALAWIGVGLAVIAAHAFTAPDATTLRDADLPWLALLGAGGLVQVFVGALTYLMPVVVGGGPQAVRQGMAVLEIAWPTRVTLRNLALALLALTTTSGAGTATVWWWALVLLSFAADVTLFAVAGVRQARARQAHGTDRPAPIPLTLGQTRRSRR